MAYTAYNGDRCVQRAFDDSQCALTDGHHGLHTTAAGGRFSTQGGKYLSGSSILPSAQCQNGRGSWQCVRVQGHDGLHVRDPHSASDLEQRIDVVAKRVEIESRERSALGNRIVELEQKFHDSRRYTNLVERIERLERDLRDTHDLAERAATAHLERKPEQWDADSAEPPRGQTYEDNQGDLWQCRDGRWFCARLGGEWSPGPYGLLWPFSSGWHLYFPWKVWTNG